MQRTPSDTAQAHATQHTILPRAAPVSGPKRWLRRLSERLLAPRTVDAGALTLSRRRIYILPTGAGLGFAAMLLVLFIGAVNYNLSMGFALIFLLGSCALVDMLLTFRNLAGLQLSATRAADVFAGQEAQFALHVANPGKLDRYAVSVAFMLPGLPEHVLDVGAHGAQALMLSAPAPRRGWQEAPRVRVSTRFPLGLLRAWSYWQPDARVLVYPTPEENAPPLPVAMSGNDDMPGLSGQGDFAGIRDYQAGDSMRRLAWRQIARLDGTALVSKHFEGTLGSELLLDFASLPKALPLELRLSRMARWVLEAGALERPYSFQLAHLRHGPATGPGHQEACLRALALYEGH